MINYVYSPDSTESTNRKLMNGQILNIVDHADWFAIFGNTYGGDGITTFALPDVRNRLFVGAGVSFTAGSFYGNPTVTLTQANLPSHNHSASGIQVKIKANSHVADSNMPVDGYMAELAGGSSYTEVPGNNEFMGDPIVSGNTGNVGANHPFDIIPPVFGVYVFIETV